VKRVAVWYWELEEVPAAWHGRGGDVDEIWAPTRFITAALRVLGNPVFPMLPAVRLPAFDPLPKAHFGLSPDRFTFLFVFDMNSRLPRKNPIALVRAFRQAFRPDEPVELAIKVSPQGEYYADWWRELRAAAWEAGVTLIDRNLSRGELLALMNAADAYASLHRSEGFGLTMAEAMLLGKPTVATGYSGNLDFMTPENSYLVNYTRAVIEDDTPPYPKGCVWAEPSVEHAAALLRRVYDHPAEARAKGERARAELLRLLSPEAAGARMKARLDALRAAREAA
jgi:glycosyltransferase involved in cell wall biosynthesis